jgi:lipoate-protein ligase A
VAGIWRVIIDESLPGIENMARDAMALEDSRKNEEPQTILRFYRWIIPTLSLGNKQDVEKAVNLDFCRDNGVDIVRRPTGGGAVLHHLELTYSIVSNDTEVFPHQSILETYKLIAAALAKGLSNLGIHSEAMVQLIDREEHRKNYIQSPVPCFTAPSHYEICVKGKKIIGSAQKRLKPAFLQHGSIPYQYNWSLQAGTMNAKEDELQASMTCIADHLSNVPRYSQMVEAFVQAFADSFKAKINVAPFSEEEIAAAGIFSDRFKVSY